jgi:uncharacterized membrane protein/nitrite reductase/ring-hydroxylating ferredoxin subunit
MKSKANIKGHPIHPILISFPIAFFTGTLLFDIIGIITGRGDLNHIAYYLQIGGVGFGLLAAVPGIIDFIYTVPPKSSGKKRAARHGLINTTALIVFAVAWYIRRGPDYSFYMLLSMEAIGVVLLSIGCWLGGTLVYRNQIGVDIRYADAGKWKEVTVSGASTPLSAGDAAGPSTTLRAQPLEVAVSSELKLNQMKLIRLGDRRIVVGRTEQGYVAFDDHCTHRGGSLAGGAMICGTVQCPWHGSQFDVHNGQVKAGPAKESIKTYRVTESNGKVYLEM